MADDKPEDAGLAPESGRAKRTPPTIDLEATEVSTQPQEVAGEPEAAAASEQAAHEQAKSEQAMSEEGKSEEAKFQEAKPQEAKPEEADAEPQPEPVEEGLRLRPRRYRRRFHPGLSLRSPALSQPQS